MSALNVYCGGSFDLFHHGHATFLRRAARLGRVVVALNTDPFIAEFKGRAPANPWHERARALQRCPYVSRVISHSGFDSRGDILSVGAQVIAIGTDWAPPRDYYAQMSFDDAWLDANAITLCYIPRTPGISSSALRAAAEH